MDDILHRNEELDRESFDNRTRSSSTCKLFKKVCLINRKVNLKKICLAMKFQKKKKSKFCLNMKMQENKKKFLSKKKLKKKL